MSRRQCSHASYPNVPSSPPNPAHLGFGGGSGGGYDPTTSGVTEGFGLMFYNARWYDPGINQFTQPDTLIPNLYNPLDWNRYSYARYNPVLYNDPTGHDPSGNCYDKGYCNNLTEAIQQMTQNQTSAEALVTMFTSNDLPGDTPTTRLNVVLNATHSGPYSHFAIPYTDSGFKDEYIDPYPETSGNQVGHFLTAVDISLNQDNILGNSAIVGHEMYPDFGGPSGASGLADNMIQIGFGLLSPKDRNLFSLGSDSGYKTIINDGWGPFGIRRGNSIEDLRLSHLGQIMANLYKDASFPDNAAIGNWLKQNIMK